MFDKRAWKKQDYKNNPEKYKGWNRQYQLKNKAKILEKTLTPEYRKAAKESVAAWRLRNPEKTKAHRAVFVALRNGSLEKEPCFCGEEKVQAHHDDYSKPLEVIWLCKPHHIGADELRKNRLIDAYSLTA